jgi:KaiC/GvpD/RAD55 family RecA-like ATPase
LEFLVSHGFINESMVGESRKYRATKWGLEYLETYKRMQKFFAALSEPVIVQTPKSVLPGRLNTGFEGLNDMLMGGIPKNYAVLLASPSCDERDMLLRRFLEAGPQSGEVTFHVTSNSDEAKILAERYRSNFHVFLCNPLAEGIAKKLPNITPLRGIENLNEINIALTGAFRRLEGKSQKPRRACVEIISDVLLQHHAVQTRKWLSSFIPELKSKQFTSLAVINPYMHASDEVQAVASLFDGEISIYEKESSEGPEKFLRIRKMRDQRYADHEMPFRTQATRQY